MKNYLPFVAFLLWASVSMNAQETPFTVTVNPDSVLFGNQIKVMFSLKNAQGSNFIPPPFESFLVVSGPNQSSSMKIINGDVSQSTEIVFYLEPKETGIFYIESASIEVNGEIQSTLPVEIIVHPNPANIRQSPEPKENDFFRQFDLFDPWEKIFPEMPNRTDSKPKPKKPERKVYKI